MSGSWFSENLMNSVNLLLICAFADSEAINMGASNLQGAMESCSGGGQELG